MGSQCSDPTTEGSKRGTLIYGLCVVFHYSIINDHCVPIFHFLFVFHIVFAAPTSHPPSPTTYIIKMFFLLLFSSLSFSLPSLFPNCIQFSNLNRMCEWSGLWQKRKTEKLIDLSAEGGQMTRGELRGR
jgi:hypothetical protein